MSRQYKTGLIITGDASGGIRAVRATNKEIGKLNQGFERGSRRSRTFGESTRGTSRELEFLQRGAATAATALASVFAVSSLRGQTQMIAETDALARSIGVATGELQAWDYAGRQVGLQSGKIGDIFKDVSDKLGDFVATGGGEAADLFENLNVNIAELQRLSPDQQLLRIGQALSEIDPGQRVFYLESIANDASRLLPLLEDNAAGLREMMQEAEALGVSMDQGAIRSAVEADRAMKQLNGTVQGLSNELIAGLAPGFTTAADGVSQLVSSLRSGDLENTATALQATAGAAAGLATVYLSVRGALIAATAAQWAFNTAMRANPLMLIASSAAAVVGGIWAVSDGMSEVESQAHRTSGEVRGLAQGFEHLARAQQKSTRSRVIDDLTRWRLEAAELGSEITKLSRLQRQSGQLTEQGGALEVITPEQLARGRQAREELAGLMTQIGAGSKSLKEMDAILAELNGEGSGSGLPGLGDNSKDSAKAAEELEKHYRSTSSQLEKQIALFGKSSQVSQLRYEIEVGDLRKLDDQRKKHLITLGREIDALDAREEMRKRIDQIGNTPSVGNTDASVGGAFGEFARIEQQRATQQNWYAEQIEMLRQYKNEEGQVHEEAAQKIMALQREQANNARINQMQSQATLAAGAAQTLSRISSMSEEGSAINQALFAMSKGFLIAQTLMQGKAAATDIMIQGQVAAAKAIAMNPIGGQATAAAVMAQTSGQAALVQGMAVANAAMIGAEALVGLSGQAHDGIDSIPNTGTWNLERGERVVDNRTNRDLKNYLERNNRQASQRSGGGGGDVHIHAPVTVKAERGMSEQEAAKQGRVFGRAFEAEVVQVMQKHKRPGGVLASVKG